MNTLEYMDIATSYRPKVDFVVPVYAYPKAVAGRLKAGSHRKAGMVHEVMG
jgi:hypothetical protein